MLGRQHSLGKPSLPSIRRVGTHRWREPDQLVRFSDSIISCFPRIGDLLHRQKGLDALISLNFQTL